MSHDNSPAKGQASTGPALLIICLHGDVSAMGLAAINAAQTLLFAPDPPRDTPDGRALRSAPGFRHIPAIPGPATTDCEALWYNMPGLASLSEPTGALRALLPGLKITRRAPLHRLGPQELAAVLPADGQVAVAIDCPGGEAGVLDAVWQGIGPDRITRIILRCGETAFFQGAIARTGIADVILAQGYEQSAVDESDPDWPVLTFQPDLKGRQITALQRQVEDLTESLAGLNAAQAQAGAREAQLAAQVRSLQTEKESADQSLAALRAEAEALRQSLASQTARADGAIRKRDQSLADQALAAQVQAMQALDLRDLRARLERGAQERQRQEDLLRKLTPRLAQAAAHLHGLQIGQADTPDLPLTGKEIAPPKPAKLSDPKNPGKRRKAKP